MLKDGLWTRTFIRTSILALRSVTPLSITYCVFRALGWVWTGKRTILRLVDVYAATESVFFLVVYLPRRWLLNSPASPSTLLETPEARERLFLKSWDASPDPREYLTGWFKGVTVEDLRSEDIKDFISWRLWNTLQRSPEHEVELERYVDLVEDILQIKFPPGKSGKTSMAVTFEPLRIVHRPLLWYLLLVGGADAQCTLLMRWYGFAHYTPSFRYPLLTIPPRPLTLLGFRHSPSTHVSYWYTPHTSKQHLPILFIHGIGVGLHFYLSFLAKYKSCLQRQGIGLIAVEILPISSRISPPLSPPLTMTMAIHQILKHHGWDRIVLASHSYGSVIATWLLRDPDMAAMIGPLLFVDPVAFSFHAPAVPWNFLRRKPRTASEWQLWYFASTDPDVAVTLTRRFDWVANSLWRDDVADRKKAGRPDEGQADGDGSSWPCTVVLAGRDIITDVDNLGAYLVRNATRASEAAEEHFLDWKGQDWKGQELEIVWNEELNHAEAFDDEESQTTLMRILETYSTTGIHPAP